MLLPQPFPRLLFFHLNSGTPPYLDLLESKVEFLASLSVFALNLSVSVLLAGCVRFNGSSEIGF